MVGGGQVCGESVVGDGQDCGGLILSWEKKKLGLVEIEFQVMIRHPLTFVGQTSVRSEVLACVSECEIRGQRWLPAL